MWDKEVFNNEITKKREKIDVKIKPAPHGKADITIRSVNRIKNINPDLIKYCMLKVKKEDKYGNKS